MRALYAPAVVVISFVLALLLFSCSARQPERETGEDRVSEEGMGESRAGDTETGDTQGSSADDRSGLRATLVPVAHLTSTRENVSMDELSGISELAVSRELRESAGEALDRSDFEEFDSTDEVLDHVSRNPEAIGLVPWDEVDPRVKALAVDGTSLLDPDAANPESYPLRSGDTAVPNARQLRRIVAAGDIVLDRGQPFAVFEEGRGIDYPLDGGYAAITGRELVPNPYSESELVYQFDAKRLGEGGAVRAYLSNADLTLANFENPVLENAVYHPEAPTFNGDLRLLSILTQGGIDGVTLANNHILDAGVPGLEETLGHLDDAGISYAGAGTDLDATREPMIFDLSGIEVGVLSYQNVPSYEWTWATETAPGTAPLREDVVSEDIERLRPEVDLLVVMPHWGIEYTAPPEPEQVELAHAMVDAGADLVVGGHAHWAKGIEVYDGKPVFYGTGNFLFDQSWSEETSTGIFVDVVLYENHVVQARPVPFIILDRSQPNFLVRDKSGEKVMNTIFSASLGPEFEAYEGQQPDDSG
jgi:poly-gamma-glutamate capsule biosynthesis protein CapA/YwtB (metallophosphatase superfamily)